MVRLLIAACALALGMSSPAHAQSDAVAEALAVQKRMNEAALHADAAVLEEVLSQDFVASPPNNEVVRRDELIALFAGGEVVYSDMSATIDFAEQLGEDLVVVMGVETSTQSASPVAAYIGRTISRRYTNVLRREDGQWKMLVKQSTLLPEE